VRDAPGTGLGAVYALSMRAPTKSEPAAPLPLSELPDERGRYGRFGGRYVPETLVPALGELEEVYRGLRSDRAFWEELRQAGVIDARAPLPDAA